MSGAGAALQVRNLTVRYGSSTGVVDVDLEIARGEAVALLGPSGSGKSTVLKAVAGFLRPTAGRILLAGRDVTELPPARRGIGVVVQSYALFPHMRVADNVAFGLRARRMPRGQVRERVAEVLDQVGMSGYEARLPRELSGGQQQRVAIARALAIRPPLLLLDEPLSALDARLREDMLAELQRLREALPDTAMLYVTHDQTEALALADRVGVMRDARLVDLAPARDLWDRPPTAFTANFLGGATLVPVTVDEPANERVHVRIGATRVAVDADPDGWEPGTDALLAVRPHGVRISFGRGADTVPARVVTTQWRGAATRVELSLDDVDGTALHADLPADTGVRAGQ
ncbi:MAG: ABC transporter ATP-binding protein, partial [Mesorhizobium sp.]|nr:ABC transporter ATP-binding protein [Mesorhizobium sp.]